MFKSSPKYAKLKTNLRLCINRLKLLEKKKTEQALKARKEIADYISSAKEDRARIRVEHIVREDYYVEAMEILELYCDLLLARFGLIETQMEMDPGLEEAISTLIWATPRMSADVLEFKVVAEQFTLKYGKEYAKAAQANSLSTVNEKVILKLGIHAPPKALIENYMIAIAKTYNVPFEPDPLVMKEDEIFMAENMLINLNEDRKNDGGGGGGGGGGMSYPPQNGAMSYPPQNSIPNPNAAFAYPAPRQPSPQGAMPPPIPSHPPVGPGGHAPVFTMPQPGGPGPPPSVPSYHELYDNNMPPSDGPASYHQAGPLPPKQNFNGAPLPPIKPNNQNDLPSLPDLPPVPDSMPPGGHSAGGEDVDFDDLTKRFEELKKKK